MTSLDWFIRNELKTRHLRLLVALDELRHVGKVASHINVTQPAVSKVLSEMEKELGLKLFERTPKGVTPTIYGESLIKHARQLLKGYNDARDDLKDLIAGKKSRLRVGVLSNVVSALLPLSVALLKRQSPGTNVLLREGTMERLLPQMLQGEIDIIVGRLAEKHSLPELESKVLAQEPVVLVTRPLHPLLLQDRLDWSDIMQYPWVLPSSEGLLHEPLERTFEQQGLSMPSDFVEALSIEFVIAYLQLTDAIATMTRDIADYYRQRSQLALIPFNFPKMMRPLGIIWTKNRAQPPALALFVSCLEKAAKKNSLTEKNLNE
ncbi:MAG: LysR family transcriptional regulator [Advenella sp.]